MENVLQATKFANFSRKDSSMVFDCKELSNSKNTPKGSPVKKRVEVVPRKGEVEQRVLAWFFQKGIKRGDPLNVLDNFK